MAAIGRGGDESLPFLQQQGHGFGWGGVGGCSRHAAERRSASDVDRDDIEPERRAVMKLNLFSWQV